MPFDGDAAVHMRRALQLAHEGWGRVHPNPLVGAVIVRDGKVVGEGYHGMYGGPHAEVEALQNAGPAARGATMFVTLEPCAHHGRTPPCTDAIIEAGIAEVVYATADPHALAGGGAARLEAAGISVRHGAERDAARSLNAAFLHIHEHGAPYVALKLAMSLDQRIAARPGTRTSITGADAAREVHRLRAGFDAILVGSETVRVDDPLLTVRDAPCRVPPVRVIVDSEARLDPASNLIRTIGDAPVWILTAGDADETRKRALGAAGARMIGVERSAHGIDLRSGLKQLADAGAQTVFVEGGSRIAASLLRDDLVHRIYVFIAPRLLGDAGVPAFRIAHAHTPVAWRFASEQRFGNDLLLTLDRVEDG